MDWIAVVNNVKLEVGFFIGLFAILFYQLQSSDSKTLSSLLLVTLWGGAAWYYLQSKNQEVVTQQEEEAAALEVDNKSHQVTTTPNFYVQPQKELAYLKKNQVLVNLTKELQFVKTFDKQKYQDLLVLLNAYQKVYMYILAERYPCQSYVPTFIDLRENILELLYQMYLVVPKTLKHIYGVDPYATLEKSIDTFLKLSRNQLKILENFCRLDLKEFYFPETNPMPFDEKVDRKNILP